MTILRTGIWSLLMLAATVLATPAEPGDTSPRAAVQRVEQRPQALGRFGANPEGGPATTSRTWRTLRRRP